MSSQFITFTALPAGAIDSGLALTVFINPNLEPGDDPRLSAFPDFVQWPGRARQLEFKARFRDVNRNAIGDVISLTPLAVPAGGVEAWRKAFPPALRVGECATASCVGPIVTAPASYDVATVRDSLRELYATELASADITQQTTTQQRDRLEKRRAELFASIKRYDPKKLKQAEGLAARSRDRTASAFRAFQAFHLPTDSGLTAAHTADDDEADFHGLISAAGQYPFLLHLFGLAIDFRVPADAIPLGDHELAIVPGGARTIFGDVTTTVLTSWTRYRHALANDARSFSILGSDGAATGFLALSDPKYEVAVEDLDGAGLSALDYVERQLADLSSALPRNGQAALPALRTKGIQVFNTKASVEIKAAQERSAQLAKLAEAVATPFPVPVDALAVAPVLFREDLVRGHRVDVRVGSGKWRSLCERVARTELTPTPTSVVEEGFLSESVTDANAATGSDTRTSQVVLRWNGWSLVVPRPGAASGADGTPTREGDQSNAFITRDRVAKGSLPKLRHGQVYEIRCRDVDLAGNGLTVAAPTPADATVSVRYGRRDPVAPPRFAAGESGKTPHLAIASRGRDLPRSAEIPLLPPIAALDLADKLGAFDSLSPDASYQLLERTRSEKAQIVDPAFAGVTATRLWPRDDNSIHVARVGWELLDADVESIVVHAGTGSYGLNTSGQSIRISVPPAGAMHVKIATFIPEARRAAFETHGYAAEPGTAVYDLIAPPADILVYHPVERPLTRPDFGSAPDPAVPPVQVEPRKSGDTHAVFAADSFSVHVESTGRFDVFGEWDEVVDAPVGASWPSRIRQRVRLFGGEVPLPEGHPLGGQGSLQRMRAMGIMGFQSPPLITPENARYDFRDTKHRKVDLTATGVSRFEDSFAKKPSDRPDRFSATSEPTSASVSNTKPPEPPRVAYVVPTLARRSSKTGRRMRDQLTEGWGLRVYLTPGDWFESGDGVRLATLFSQPPDQGRLSQIAGDPMVEAAAVVNDLTSSDFIGARSEHANLKQLVGMGGVPAARAVDSGFAYDYVSASTFDVGWDAEKELIYSDLVLRRRSGYRPFVRLALARFQPDSIDGAHLSTTTLADFIQLSPERTLSIVRRDGEVSLRLIGSFPRQSGASRVRTLLLAIVEKGLRSSRDREWSETGRSAFALQHATADLEASVWTASLPNDLLSDSCNRIVIEEWEAWADPATRQPTPGRLVYSDAVEL